MNSPKMVELQALAADIVAARSRLYTARQSNNLALVQSLEEEIAATEARRSHLKANMTTDVVGAVETAGHPEAIEAIAPPNDPAAVEAAWQNEADKAASSVASEGVTVMSDQLTAIDVIEGANRQLATQRAKMLARHAEEIGILDADQSEIDAMAQAMNAFVRKFNLVSAESSGVRFDEARNVRAAE